MSAWNFVTDDEWPDGFNDVADQILASAQNMGAGTGTIGGLDDYGHSLWTLALAKVGRRWVASLTRQDKPVVWAWKR